MGLIIFLFTLGILLLAAEIFLPSGIIGIVGGILLLIGCFVSFSELGATGGFIAVFVMILSAIAVFYFEFKILPKTRFGKRFFLNRDISGSAGALKEDAKDLIGKTATSVTVLSPSGYVIIDGKQYEAYSQSGQIPINTTLEVVSANSFQLTVKAKN